MNTIESIKGSRWQSRWSLQTVKAMALGMCLAVGLVGCGGGSSGTAATTTPPAASTAPGAPTIGTATGGNTQATVAFTAPASNGGSAIIGYTVTSNPAGGTDSNAGTTALTHTITGLTNGTSYTFTVVATNAIGNSAASAASNSVIPAAPVAPTAPGAPTIGTATGGAAQATIAFTAPASNGGSAITGYTVTSSPGGFTASGAASPITVTGLTNGTAYTFTVIATNGVGTSVASGASNAVTPATLAGGLVTSTASQWALGGAADFNGATSSLVTSQPVGGLQSNAAMVVVPAAAQYFGTTFLTLVNQEFCTTLQPTITLEVYAPAAGKLIDLKLEQDGNPALNIEMHKTSVAGWQTLTFNCLTDSGSATTPPTAPYVEGTVYNKMSVLFDFLAVSPGETWYFDQLTYTPTAAVTYVPPPPFTAPTTAATGPAHPVLFSVLTNTGVDLAGTNFFPNWGQSTVYAPLTIGGVETAEYSVLNYEGIQLAANTNVTSATHVHFDVWTNVTSLGFDLISINPGTLQFQVNSTLTSGWNSVDIPLSSFTGVDLTGINQLSFTGVTPAAGGTIYIQNLYFW